MTDPSLLREYTKRTGKVICQICCEIKTKDELQPVSTSPSKHWDVCKDCAEREVGSFGAEY